MVSRDAAVLRHRRSLEYCEGTVRSAVPELTIRVRDQGLGFDPELLANPLDPENLLKSSGRGIFLIRSFMDDVRLRKLPGE